MKYVCSNCGFSSLKWEGKCSSCGQWGTLDEVDDDHGAIQSSKISQDFGMGEYHSIENDSSQKHKRISLSSMRFSSKIGEFDRVLGGGIVHGEVILMSGQPGIGKSTILLQIAIGLAKEGKVLYVSGEESYGQIYSRIERISGKDILTSIRKNFLISNEINVEKIIPIVEKEIPSIVVIDSIQTICSLEVRGVLGGQSQIRTSTVKLAQTAKKLGVPFILVGQVTKEGSIAGPKLIEHMVDCVLYMEGDEFNYFRVLRCVKNRFGSTNEIGVFEMKSGGLEEVIDPSKAFLQTEHKCPGTAIGAIIKGSRIIFVEVQALTIDQKVEGIPLRRVANGIKKSRLDMLAAVLSRRGGVFLGDKDIFVNIGGGITIDDPTIDLAVCAAIKSAVLDKPLERSMIYAGEVALTGEIRGFLGLENVINEANRLGYKKVVCSDTKNKSNIEKIRLISQLL